MVTILWDDGKIEKIQCNDYAVNYPDPDITIVYKGGTWIRRILPAGKVEIIIKKLPGLTASKEE